MLGKTRACATVVPVLQLRVLRDNWYHTEVVGAVTVRQLKGNRETYPRVIIYLTAAEICNDANRKRRRRLPTHSPGLRAPARYPGVVPHGFVPTLKGL